MRWNFTLRDSMFPAMQARLDELLPAMPFRQALEQVLDEAAAGKFG